MNMTLHVTVALQQGDGATFTDMDSAPDYAETEMHKLLGEYEELEAEDFDGVYCECEISKRVWRFDYESESPAWVLTDQAFDFARRAGALRQGGALCLAGRDPASG
jgi:hypothetical protein